MAGLVIGVGTGVRADALAEGTRLLRHHASFQTELLHVEPGLGVGACFRADDRPGVAVDRARRLAVVVTGRPVDRDRERVTGAAEILASIAAHGAGHLTHLDGAFQILAVDGKQRSITLVNDRMATLPMHLVQGEGVVALATEGKAALRLASRPTRLDRTGALEFLAYGHAVGSRTLLEDVALLEPASVVTVDLDIGIARVQRYWDLAFRPRPHVDEHAAARELDARIDLAVRAAVNPPPASSQLLLTGGYDSRTLLAYLDRAGRRPDRAVTWGTREDEPRSDVYLARGIAASFGVPFDFVPYGHTTFAERARHWAVVAELASDNLGNFAGGPTLLLDGINDAATTFIGDHMFGAGGIPVHARDAVEAGAGVPGDGSLPVGLSPFIAEGARTDVADELHAGLRAIVARCDTDVPKDLQDYLGLHLRVARWLNAPTYFREPFLSVCRPMLHAPVVELFTELPPYLRVDRRLHVTMLRQQFPGLLRHPLATVSSLIDWDDAFRGSGSAAAFLATLLEPGRLAASPLAGVLDLVAIARHHNVFALGAGPRSRQYAPRWLPQLRRTVSRSHLGSMAIRRLQRLTTRSLGRTVGVTRDRALIRLGLLSLFVGVLNDGDLARAGVNSRADLPTERQMVSWWTEPAAP